VLVAEAAVAEPAEEEEEEEPTVAVLLAVALLPAATEAENDDRSDTADVTIGPPGAAESESGDAEAAPTAADESGVPAGWLFVTSVLVLGSVVEGVLSPEGVGIGRLFVTTSVVGVAGVVGFAGGVVVSGRVMGGSLVAAVVVPPKSMTASRAKDAGSIAVRRRKLVKCIVFFLV
jgi:hypothetical protein